MSRLPTRYLKPSIPFLGGSDPDLWRRDEGVLSHVDHFLSFVSISDRFHSELFKWRAFNIILLP